MSLYAQTGKPNIVVIMTDQQRADLCGREGFPMEITPYVDELAHQNAWFDKAYTVMPASSPARCSMFTGRFPSATHVRTNHNVRDVHYAKDLVTVLKENHYKTALVGKKTLLFISRKALKKTARSMLKLSMTLPLIVSWWRLMAKCSLSRCSIYQGLAV